MPGCNTHRAIEKVAIRQWGFPTSIEDPEVRAGASASICPVRPRIRLQRGVA
jgi:hypothetical protein